MKRAASFNNEGFRVLGFVRDRVGYPSFVTPCFIDGAHKLYVQRVSPFDDFCVDFLQLEISIDDISPFSCSGIFVAGEPSLYAFAWSEDDVIVGEKYEVLKNVLGRAGSSKLPVTVALQLADLSANHHDKARARSRIRTVIGAGAGEAAALNYDVSLARAEMWDVISRSGGAALREWAAADIYRSIDVIFKNGRMVPVFSARIADALGTDLLEAAKRLFRQSMQSLPEQGDLFDADDSNAPAHSHSVTGLLIKARALRRQEERIAHLIEAIIEVPDIGIPAVQEFRDTAAFANRAASILREHIREGDDKDYRISIISQLIPKFFGAAFPMNRGVMLFVFAETLGRYASIGRSILKKTRESESQFVRPYKADIESILNLTR